MVSADKGQIARYYRYCGRVSGFGCGSTLHKGKLLKAFLAVERNRRIALCRRPLQISVEVFYGDLANFCPPCMYTESAVGTR